MDDFTEIYRKYIFEGFNQLSHIEKLIFRNKYEDHEKLTSEDKDRITSKFLEWDKKVKERADAHKKIFKELIDHRLNESCEITIHRGLEYFQAYAVIDNKVVATSMLTDDLEPKELTVTMVDFEEVNQ